MKSEIKIVEMALRDLGVLASDESATADMVAAGKAKLAGIISELNAKGPLVPFVAVQGISDGSMLALANLLAVDLARSYGEAPPSSRASAWIRLRSTFVTDDREDVKRNGGDDYGNC